jgi:hypothetical protein
LSDLIHQGSVIPIALKFSSMLPDAPKGNVPKEAATEQGEKDLLTRNLNPMVRVLDAIGNNDHQFEPLDFLVGRMERVLRKEDYMKMMNPGQSARLLKIFAQASHILV